MRTSLFSTVATLAVMGVCMVATPALALDPVTGKPLLTVVGRVGAQNAPNAAEFDLRMLEKLPQQTFTTKTPWSKDPIKFKGPFLRDVLAAAKATGSTIKASALNDYQTVIPMDDAKNFGVIVAYQMNDQLIPVRTKGPLFIVYPFDSTPELRSSTYYERSAWQLKSMRIE